jgi:DNA-binding NarL/FixJ family response regulator
MSVRIAVLDPLPMFRRGIMAMLGAAALEFDAPDDILAVANEEPRRVVLLTLQSAEDWELLSRLRERRPEVLVVAVLQDVATPNYLRAILSGASAVMPRDAHPDLVRRVFEDAIGGSSLLPIEVVHALSSSATRPDEDQAVRPTPQELLWLRQLADGTTVGTLAHEAGYSERAMFRLLRQLYRKIGARNRTEALVLSSQRGWLQDIAAAGPSSGPRAE